MTTLTEGSAPVSAELTQIAYELLDQLPVPSHLLIGLAYARAVVDFAIVLPAAVLVATDATRFEQGNPHAAAATLAAATTIPVPIHAFWFGKLPLTTADGLPQFDDAATILHAVEKLNEKEWQLDRRTVDELADRLITSQKLASDSPTVKQEEHSPISLLRHSVSDLLALPRQLDKRLQSQVRQPFMLRRWSGTLQPADLNKSLVKALFDEAHLTTRGEMQIVPNQFAVTLHPDDYVAHFRPNQPAILTEWQAYLRDALDTANQRHGRTRYRWDAPLSIVIETNESVARNSAEIAATTAQPATPVEPTVAFRPNRTVACHIATQPCLRLPNNTTISLYEDLITLGRHPDATITLPDDDLLLSSYHATLRRTPNGYTLHDGNPNARPSTNGTAINGQPVDVAGKQLNKGDKITLAGVELTYEMC